MGESGSNDQAADHVTNTRCQPCGADALVHGKPGRDRSVQIDGVSGVGDDPGAIDDGIAFESSVDPVEGLVI